MISKVFHPLDMDKVLREQGAERVSEDASRRLSRELEDVGEEILFKARVLANYAGRKSIKKSDIYLAAKKIIR